MENPKKLIVRAFIPSTDNAEAHVLHVTGTEPLEVGTIASSQEHLLHTLGQRVLASGHLTIDIQESRQNIYDTIRKSHINVSDLRTKPIDRSQARLTEQYRWSDE